MTDPIRRATELARRARTVTVFTGAGISAESGIPTYRGEGGLWKQYDPAKYADIGCFRKDPTYYWSFFRDVRYDALVKSAPNAGHRAIAGLEAAGRGGVVITQNIDGLHQQAGSTKVIELHGNTRIIGCLECGADYEFDEVKAKVAAQLPPRCDACGGLLKPRVVFFGEALPPGAMEAAAEAAATCDLLLVVGSTLQVFPAASIPLVARRAGARIVIVNVGPTAMDELADVVVDGKAGEVLPGILGQSVPAGS
jgi:NAD-dependent deacetylase